MNQRSGSEFSFGAALRHFSKKCWLETWIIGAIERKGVTVIEQSPPMNGMAVFSVEEMDAPGYRAIIRATFPEQLKTLPEDGEITIIIMPESSETTVQEVQLNGRSGLIDWYLNEVGFSPDEDGEEITPMLNLLDRVASHLLLRAYADNPKAEL